MEQIVAGAARDFDTSQSSDSKECFVHFERLNCRIGAKDPLRGGKAFQEYPQQKGSGANDAFTPL